MRTKLLELRDRNTFIPIIAVEMHPGEPLPEAVSNYAFSMPAKAQHNCREYLLRRCGYVWGREGAPSTILVTRLQGGKEAECDPYSWGDRTYCVAHQYIEAHWAELSDGDVVDVEHILGETATPKQSERITDLDPSS